RPGDAVQRARPPGTSPPRALDRHRDVSHDGDDFLAAPDGSGAGAGGSAMTTGEGHSASLCRVLDGGESWPLKLLSEQLLDVEPHEVAEPQKGFQQGETTGKPAWPCGGRAHRKLARRLSLSRRRDSYLSPSG